MCSIRFCAFFLLCFIGAFYAGQVVAQVPPQVQRGPLKVAIIDTGVAPHSSLPFCPTGHRDFTGHNDLSDLVPGYHGTHVARLIATSAGPLNYCLIILKVHDGNQTTAGALEQALAYAGSLKVDIINISMGGSTYLPFETFLIKRLLDGGTRIVTAAGNDRLNFSKVGCRYWPACSDPRVLVVGSFNTSTSNKGAGVDIYLDGTLKGSDKTGTSFAAPRATGLLIRQILGARK